MTPAAIEPLLAMQNATTVPDAVSHAIAAINAGASAAEAQQAIDAWVALQGAQVQQVFAGPARRDCCTGIHREHVTRCKCDGLRSQHGIDRSGRPTCFHSPLCGCTEFREKDQ